MYIYIYLINVYTFRHINICFISRLNQDSLTPPYTRQTPPHLTPPKKKYIHNIISFADRKLGQMHRLTKALNLVVLRKRFPSWPTRTIINRMARLARTPYWNIFCCWDYGCCVNVFSQICQSIDNTMRGFVLRVCLVRRTNDKWIMLW